MQAQISKQIQYGGETSRLLPYSLTNLLSFEKGNTPSDFRLYYKQNGINSSGILPQEVTLSNSKISKVETLYPAYPMIDPVISENKNLKKEIISEINNFNRNNSNTSGASIKEILLAILDPKKPSTQKVVTVNTLNNKDSFSITLNLTNSVKQRVVSVEKRPNFNFDIDDYKLIERSIQKPATTAIKLSNTKTNPIHLSENSIFSISSLFPPYSPNHPSISTPTVSLQKGGQVSSSHSQSLTKLLGMEKGESPTSLYMQQEYLGPKSTGIASQEVVVSDSKISHIKPLYPPLDSIHPKIAENMALQQQIVNKGKELMPWRNDITKVNIALPNSDTLKEWTIMFDMGYPVKTSFVLDFNHPENYIVSSSVKNEPYKFDIETQKSINRFKSIPSYQEFILPSIQRLSILPLSSNLFKEVSFHTSDSPITQTPPTIDITSVSPSSNNPISSNSKRSRPMILPQGFKGPQGYTKAGVEPIKNNSGNIIGYPVFTKSGGLAGINPPVYIDLPGLLEGNPEDVASLRSRQVDTAYIENELFRKRPILQKMYPGFYSVPRMNINKLRDGDPVEIELLQTGLPAYIGLDMGEEPPEYALRIKKDIINEHPWIAEKQPEIFDLQGIPKPEPELNMSTYEQSDAYFAERGWTRETMPTQQTFTNNTGSQREVPGEVSQGEWGHKTTEEDIAFVQQQYLGTNTGMPPSNIGQPPSNIGQPPSNMGEAQIVEY